MRSMSCRQHSVLRSGTRREPPAFGTGRACLICGSSGSIVFSCGTRRGRWPTYSHDEKSREEVGSIARRSASANTAEFWGAKQRLKHSNSWVTRI